MYEIRNRSIIEAIQEAAHGYGLKALAPMLDKRPSTLYAELDPWGDPGKAKLGLDDGLEIMRITGDYTGLELAAAAHGFRLFPMNAAPDKATVAEELADDTQKIGVWARVCMRSDATEAEVHLAAEELRRDVDETEMLKVAEVRRRA